MLRAFRFVNHAATWRNYQIVSFIRAINESLQFFFKICLLATLIKNLLDSFSVGLL